MNRGILRSFDKGQKWLNLVREKNRGLTSPLDEPVHLRAGSESGLQFASAEYIRPEWADEHDRELYACDELVVRPSKLLGQLSRFVDYDQSGFNSADYRIEALGRSHFGAFRKVPASGQLVLLARSTNLPRINFMSSQTLDLSDRGIPYEDKFNFPWLSVISHDSPDGVVWMIDAKGLLSKDRDFGLASYRNRSRKRGGEWDADRRLLQLELVKHMLRSVFVIDNFDDIEWAAYEAYLPVIVEGAESLENRGLSEENFPLLAYCERATLSPLLAHFASDRFVSQGDSVSREIRPIGPARDLPDRWARPLVRNEKMTACSDFTAWADLVEHLAQYWRT